MLARRVVLLTLAGLLSGLDQHAAWAHAGPRLSDPLEGATLGDTPTLVRLYFSEQPETSLSSILVLDTLGVAYQAGRPTPVPGDPLSLAVRVRPLPTGVYLVSWRTVSAVDGHVTAGVYAFGVRATPTTFATRAASPGASRFEILARFIFIAGLVALLGTAAAVVTGVAGGSGLALGVGGWLLAALGLALLAAAQRSSASAPWTDLLKTSVGRALIGRAIALSTAGVALLCVQLAPPRLRRWTMSVVALASLAAMAVHVSNGHAAAGGRWPAAAAVAAQWGHFAAVGIWVGGLAAVLMHARRAPSETLSASVFRFSAIAGTGLLLVAATGTMLTAGVLTSWNKAWTELISTAYGLTVLAKVALICVIAALGAVNRWRSVPAARTDLRPLRRTGSVELTFMAGALLAAAMLGALPPPAGGAPAGLDVTGTDFGTTVRVHLTTPSDQPGPNRFVVEVLDYDSKAPLRASRVTLRFSPLDDPGVASTSLPLAPGADATYVGSGANVSFDGRWRVTALIEREKDSVEVPLDVEARRPPQRVSIERDPGQDPFYDVEISRSTGQMRFSPHPERAGPSQVSVLWLDSIGDIRPLDEMVVTAGGGRGPVRQQPVRRVGDRFVADIQLEAGPNRIAAIGRTRDGTRLRAALTIEIPNR